MNFLLRFEKEKPLVIVYQRAKGIRTRCGWLVVRKAEPPVWNDSRPARAKAGD